MLWWLISTLTALALGISGSTVVTHASMLAQHAKRLATLETQMQHDSKRLERIEGKLDAFFQKLP